jgi:cytochrome c5
MKKLILSIAVSGILFLVFQSFILNPPQDTDFPAGVKEVLKTSCNDCHSSGSSNQKAPLALNFDKWNDYKTSKKISKLESICEVIGENKMPPEKYLKGNPGKALSDEQKALVCKWSEEESTKLLGGN